MILAQVRVTIFLVVLTIGNNGIRNAGTYEGGNTQQPIHIPPPPPPSSREMDEDDDSGDDSKMTVR